MYRLKMTGFFAVVKVNTLTAVCNIRRKKSRIKLRLGRRQPKKSS